MPKVTIQPLNVTLEAEDGATIMEAAWPLGLYGPTAWGAQGICTPCACTIDEGAGNLDPIGRTERKTLAAERGQAALRDGTLRLACQARLRGDVVVTKPGVRPARAAPPPPGPAPGFRGRRRGFRPAVPGRAEAPAPVEAGASTYGPTYRPTTP